jgi:hypothetical protein
MLVLVLVLMLVLVLVLVLVLAWLAVALREGACSSGQFQIRISKFETITESTNEKK